MGWLCRRPASIEPIGTKRCAWRSAPIRTRGRRNGHALSRTATLRDQFLQPPFAPWALGMMVPPLVQQAREG